MKPNECSIIKHASVRLPKDRVLLAAYVSHTDKEDRKKSWYKCYATILSKEKLDSLTEQLMKAPAQELTLEELGITDEHKDLNIYYSRITQTHSTFSKWLMDKLMKPIEPAEFVEKYLGNTKTLIETEYTLMSDGKTPVSFGTVEQFETLDFEGWAEKFVPHKRDLPKVKKPKKLLPGAEPQA